MRPEKEALVQEYLSRLAASPFVITVNYQGLNVTEFTELRRRLTATESEVHVVKNTLFRRALKEAGLPDFGGQLRGQVACVTGRKDISAAARVVKEFQKEFKKLEFVVGCLDGELCDADMLQRLADLPPLDVLRGMLLGTVQAPAGKLVRTIQAPVSQLVRVIQARVEKEQAAA